MSREGDDFEEHVATPHGLDFAHAAALFGCGYERRDAEDFRAALDRALAADAHEHRVRTDREANVALHAAVWQEVAQSVRPAPSVRRRGSGQLIDDPGASPPAARRTTSKGIGAGDIVLVDKKGRRFHALVTELDQLESGRFELAVGR